MMKEHHAVFSILLVVLLALQCSSMSVEDLQTEKLQPDAHAVEYFKLDDDDLKSIAEYEENLDDLAFEEEITLGGNMTMVRQGRITGDPTPITAGTYPFMVSVTSTSGTGVARSCSGVLITTQYVLTAASCVYDGATVGVAPGVVTPTAPTVFGNAIVHPKFTNIKDSSTSTNNGNYDIALIRLKTAVTVTANIDIVSIAAKEQTSETKHLAGKTVLVIGYGLPTIGGAAGMYRTSMRVMTDSQCKRAMRSSLYRLGSLQSCLDTNSASSGTVGMCTQADIGGPVLYNFGTDSFSLVGITNYYQSCGSSTPNVFTRIGPFLELIRKTIQNYLPNQG